MRCLLLLIWVLIMALFYLAGAAQAQTNEIEKLRAAVDLHNDALKELLNQLALLKWGVGAVVTALCTTIGLLYRDLVAARKDLVEYIKTESVNSKEEAKKTVVALVENTAATTRATQVQAELTRQQTELGRKLDHLGEKLSSAGFDTGAYARERPAAAPAHVEKRPSRGPSDVARHLASEEQG